MTYPVKSCLLKQPVFGSFLDCKQSICWGINEAASFLKLSNKFQLSCEVHQRKFKDIFSSFTFFKI